MKPLTMTEAQERLLRDRVVENGNYTMETFGARVSLSDVVAEVDALRAALAAAEAALADANKAALDMMNRHRDEVLSLTKQLADERRRLTAALEAERLHADALYAALDQHDGSVILRALKAHAARREQDALDSEMNRLDAIARRAAEVK